MSPTEPNTPNQKARTFSLSPPWRWGKRGLRQTQSAPILPKFDFEESHDSAFEKVKSSKPDNDMNDTYARTHEEASTLHKQSAMPVFTAPRNMSGPLAVDSAPLTSDASAGGVWNRSNPHTMSQNNRTSQYIDKITSENERLNRELKAVKLARAEEKKLLEAAGAKAAEMRAEFQHLQVVADANARALERKDRKLEDLKAALEIESGRRKAAESRADEALAMLGETRSYTQRQLAEANEVKDRALANYDAARIGYKRITDAYEKKVKAIAETLNEIRMQRRQDRDKLKRQALITDQLQHELTRHKRTEDSMADVMGKYKAEHRKEIELLHDEATRLRTALPQRERQAARLAVEMQETKDKMKWVMNQQNIQNGTSQLSRTK